MNIDKAVRSLQSKGYIVSVFPDGEAACKYLNEQIDGSSVGMGGSETLTSINAFETLSQHNVVYSHHHVPSGKTADDMRKAAMDTDVYLCSVNALSEDGEMVNIDGAGNRVSSTLYGHNKVYFVVGTNKIVPDLHQAIDRAQNIAAPMNAKRLHCKTPCAVKGDKCYHCASSANICRAMVVHYGKMISCDMEVVLVEESLGF